MDFIKQPLIKIGRRYLLAGLLLVSFAPVNFTQAQSERDYISIISSDLYYPLISKVLDEFVKNTKYKYPHLQFADTVSALEQFCTGLLLHAPELMFTSRRIHLSELLSCELQNSDNIVEVRFGSDAIVFIGGKLLQPFNLTRKDLFLALAAYVPNILEESEINQTHLIIDNQYDTWQRINPELPDIQIRIIGPHLDSSMGRLFIKKVMEPGCREIPVIAAMEEEKPEEFTRICHSVRRDNDRFIESGLNGALLRHQLAHQNKIESIEKQSVLVANFGFLKRYKGEVQVFPVDGVEPTFRQIRVNKYPLSMPLYLYLKKNRQNLIPGLRELVREFLSEDAMRKARGYLIERGLVTLRATERRQQRSIITNMTTLDFASILSREVGRLKEKTFRSREDKALLETYLELFPTGANVDLARAMLQGSD